MLGELGKQGIRQQGLKDEKLQVGSRANLQQLRKAYG